MRMYDIINKKKNGNALLKEEIEFVVNGFTNGDIPDYQMSSLLMAIYFNGMNEAETSQLTLAMANSGDMVDLSLIKGIKVDKHSTGGVGDKTSLIIAPIVAYFGVPVAKMSGRGLGHTGGTIDKLESIPNLRTALTKNEFIDIVNEKGLCIAGQSGNLAPADKKIYALRDVTATVDSIPLIASSIMSKKIAAGSDCILLDVKTGSGAFMKTVEDSVKLAETMVKIGEACGRRTVALITDMDRPLGNAIGNILEICEVVETLKGEGPKDLTDMSIELASNMLCLADKGTLEECREMVKDVILNGKALFKLADMVEAQGGDRKYIEDTSNFETAKIVHTIKADKTGFIDSMDVEGCGIASMILGAGRETSESEIDFSAGIVVLAKTGDFVEKGEPLAVLHTSSKEKLEQGIKKFLESIVFSVEKPSDIPLIYARVDANN